MAEFPIDLGILAAVLKPQVFKDITNDRERDLLPYSLHHLSISISFYCSVSFCSPCVYRSLLSLLSLSLALLSFARSDLTRPKQNATLRVHVFCFWRTTPPECPLPHMRIQSKHSESDLIIPLLENYQLQSNRLSLIVNRYRCHCAC